MTDLTDFLLARIAEDEAVAKAATQGRWFWTPESSASFPQGDQNLHATEGEWYTCGYYCDWPDSEDGITSRGPKPRTPGHEHLRSTGVVQSFGHDSDGIIADDADREFIIRNQPSRVLAECEAKRRIVERYQAIFAEWHEARRNRQFHMDGAEESVWFTLKDLAQPYADHPDFRPEWAPTD